MSSGAYDVPLSIIVRERVRTESKEGGIITTTTTTTAAATEVKSTNRSFTSTFVSLYKQEYLESRSSAVQEVEGHIAELGLIFNKLATMLQDQRELVEKYVCGR